MQTKVSVFIKYVRMCDSVHFSTFCPISIFHEIHSDFFFFSIRCFVYDFSLYCNGLKKTVISKMNGNAANIYYSCYYVIVLIVCLVITVSCLFSRISISNGKYFRLNIYPFDVFGLRVLLLFFNQTNTVNSAVFVGFKTFSFEC